MGKYTGFFRNKRFNSIFIKFNVTFCIFFIIPVIIASITLYFYTTEIVESEVKNANIALLKHTMDIVDTKFGELRRIVIEQMQKSSFLKLTYPIENQEDLITCLSDSLSDLKHTKSVNDFITGSFIYYKLNNKLITDKGIIDFNANFSRYQVYEGISTKEWENIFNKSCNFSIINTTTVRRYEISGDITNVNRYITILTSVPLHSVPKSIIGLQVSEYNLDEILNKAGLTKNGAVLIVDEENNLIANSSNEIKSIKSYETQIHQLIKDQSGSRIIGQNGRIMVSFITSEITGWKFIAIVPYGEITAKLDIIRSFTLVICIIFLLLGIFISYVTSKRFYSPIKNIIELINEKQESGINTSNVKANEFAKIANRFQDVLLQNKKLKDIVDINVADIRYKFYIDLISGKYPDDSIILEKAAQWGIDLQFKYYSVSVLKMEFLDEAYEQFKESEIVKIKTGLSSIINTIIGSKNISEYVFETGKDEFTAITNSDSNDSSFLKHEFGKVLEIFENDRDFIRITISIMPFIVQISQIPLLYKQAVETVNYRTFEKVNRIIEYNGIKDIIKNADVYYPDEAEENIRNMLINGSYNEAILKAVEIINKNYENAVPYKLFSSVLTGLFNILVRVSIQKNIPMELIFDDCSNPYEKLVQCVTIKEICGFFAFKYEKVGKYILSQKKGSAEFKMNRILDFITENYCKDIYLDLLAEKVGMSSKYISRFFKEQTGVYFIDYINRIRIEKAKELLIQPEAKLEDIAERTGFKNLSTFLRTFKKYEGVAPNTYKQLNFTIKY